MQFVHQFLLNTAQPVLQGHRVQGRCVLPGLAYIDLLYQSFAEQVADMDQLVLRNLSIYSPLMLEDGESVELDIEWTQATAQAWTVAVQGRVIVPGGGAKPAVRYAAAEMQVADAQTFDDVIDPQQLRQQAQRVVDLGDQYVRCRAQGLVHDAFMRAEGETWSGETGLFAELNLGELALNDAADSVLHPALIDAAAVALGLASQDEVREQAQQTQPVEPQLFLPLFFDSFRASRPLPPRCFVRVCRDSIQQRHELRYMSLEFFDEAGCKIAQLSNLTAKLVRKTGLAVASPSALASDPVAVVQAQPTDEAGASNVAPQAAERFLRELIGRHLQRSPSSIPVDVGYYELGLNSAYLMQLGLAVSRKVGVDLPPTLMFEYPTLSELASHLAQRYPGRFADAAVADAPASDAPQLIKPTAAVRGPSGPAVAHSPVADGLQEPVAIIGISGRFPKAADLSAFWALLREGADCITEVPGDRWSMGPYFDAEKGLFGKTYSKWGSFIDGVAEFDSLFFGISPREAQVMDPQGRLFLETVWNLLEERGHTRESLQRDHGGRVGVYVGAMYQQYAPLNGSIEWDSVSSLTSYSAIANRVSHFFGLQGPSLAIDTMCSSSAMAIHQACKDLASGECELAIAGGVNLSIHPKKYIGLSQVQLLGSHPGSRSFADGDGYLPGEGVAAVLLKPLHRAIADGDTVLAVIRGTAALHSGRANAYMEPNLAAQARVMRQSLQRAGLTPADIGYVESAANGSALGDPIEVAAMARVWADAAPSSGKAGLSGARCALGSVKSNLGHPEAVSGMAQLAKVVLQLLHRELVPLAGQHPLNPNLRLDGTPFTLQREVAPWNQPMRRALINSFAAGGNYVSLVVEEAPQGLLAEQPVDAAPSGSEHIFVFSARTPERLRALVGRMKRHVESQPDLSLADLAYTLQVGREAMPLRLAAVVSSRIQLLDVLQQYLSSPDSSAAATHTEAESFYRADVDEAGPKLRQLLGADHLADLVMVLTARQDWHRIAALWVQGADVAWHTWPRARRMRRLVLPTYPFAKECYWFPQSADIPAPASAPASAPGIGVAQELASAHLSPAIPDCSGDLPLDQRIQSCIASFLQSALSISSEQLMPNRALRDYGLDSIIGMKLARHLSAQFGIEVTGRDMLQHPSAASLARHLAGKTRVGPVSVQQPQMTPPRPQTDPMPARPVAAPAEPPAEPRAEPRADSPLVAALEQFQRGELEMAHLKSLIERSPTV